MLPFVKLFTPQRKTTYRVYVLSSTGWPWPVLLRCVFFFIEIWMWIPCPLNAGAQIWSLGKYHLLLSLLLSILSSTLTVFITENTPLLFSTLIPGDPEIALINQSSDNEQWIITMGGGLLNAMRWKKKRKQPRSPREVFIWDLRIWMFLQLSLETHCGYFCHWPYPSQV